MAVPDPLPLYVYKIVPTAPPDPIPAQYPLSELDQADGFVHLSIASQIPITASLFFKGNDELWVIRIKFRGSRLGDATDTTTNWNTPGCPHLYGNFGADDIDAVKRFERYDGEDWKSVMGVEVGRWLE